MIWTEEQLTQISVRVGSDRHDSGGDVYRVRKIVGHEDYNKPTPRNNDIAVVILSKDLIFTPFVQIIQLPPSIIHLAKGTRVRVSGWGKTSMQSEDRSPILRAVTLNIFDQRYCKLSIPYIYNDNMICAGTRPPQEGKNVCSVRSYSGATYKDFLLNHTFFS